MAEINENELKEIREKTTEVIPNGYIKIELGTHGEYGAPKEFHVRNFITEDLMGLALSNDEDVQFKVIDMIQSLIFEKDVDVKQFHEKEVQEMLLIIYKNFYQSTLRELVWELTEEDKEEIAKQCGGKDTDLYRRRLAAIEAGDEKHFFDIDLNQVKFYQIENANTTARVTKKDGFICEYTYPRYGDILVLKKFMMQHEFFKKGEKQYAAIRENLKFKQQMEERWRKGEAIPLERIPKYPEIEIKAFYNYEEAKAKFLTRAVKAMHLKSIDGQDVSQLPLEEKMKYAEDPRLDHSTFQKISKLYEELKIGPQEHVKVVDPILGKVVEIPYTFRIFTLLQALRDNNTDGDISFVK